MCMIISGNISILKYKLKLQYQCIFLLTCECTSNFFLCILDARSRKVMYSNVLVHFNEHLEHIIPILHYLKNI